MTILITGGCGFIGSHFVDSWLQRSAEPLINLDKLTYAADLAVVNVHKERGILVEGSINDAALVNDLMVKHKPRAVINFAAETHVDRSISAPADFIETNINGVLCLLMAARDYWAGLAGQSADGFVFLQISTDEVYGSLAPEDAPSIESAQILPNSPYSASKASSDLLARAFHKTYGLPVIISRCSNNFGPGQNSEKFIPTIVRSLANARKVPIYGHGRQSRDWLFVEDHIEAIHQILEKGKIGEIYNIGAGNELENINLVRLIFKSMRASDLIPSKQGFDDLVDFVSDRPGHDQRYALNSEKLFAATSWQPRHGFNQALAKTVQWYCDQQKYSASQSRSNHLRRAG